MRSTLLYPSYPTIPCLLFLTTAVQHYYFPKSHDTSFRSLLTKSSLPPLLFVVMGGKDVHGQQEGTVEEFQNQMQTKIQQAFDQQKEAHAIWLLDWIFQSPLAMGTCILSLGTQLAQMSKDPLCMIWLPPWMIFFKLAPSARHLLVLPCCLLLESRSDSSLNDNVQELVPDFALEFPQYANYTVENL